MKIRFVSLTLMLLALLSPLPVTAAAQHPKLLKFTPMFTVLRYHGTKAMQITGSLPYWNGSFTYKTKVYTYTMVGLNPAKSDVTTTIPVYIIPIKMVFGATNGSMTFDPVKKQIHYNSIIQTVINSPIFDGTVVDFNQGGTDLGTTQYIDAFQRGNFWSSVSSRNPDYHVLLGTPTVLAEQTIHVKASQGLVVSASGISIGLMNINDFDTIIQGYIASFAQLNPGVLPIFITYNIYLSDTSDTSGCCIGGYHSYNGANTYIVSTYVGTPGLFAQDVSALSHEVGEWMDDPFTNNVNVPALCGTNPGSGQILEVGDPLEAEANYGGYPYHYNRVTYNLQDLVLLPYFGAPPARSVNSWKTFQGTPLTVCQNGG